MNNRIAPSKINDEDEINLLYIVYNTLTLIKKNVPILLGIILLSVFIGIFQYFKTEPLYKTRLIADSFVLPNTEIINIVETWQGLINKGDYSTLAGKLKLGEATVKKILSLEAQNTGTGKTEQSIDSKNENSFVINASVTDVQIIDSLEIAIISALESNEYVMKRVAIRKENSEALKKRIASEIADLDTIKQSVRNLLEIGRPASGTFITNPTDVNVRIIELYEKILELESTIQLSEDIQVIESFTKTTRPDGPKLLPYLIYGFTSGCVLAGCFIIFRAININYKNYLNSSVFNS
jgi:hypothetical protein